MPKLYKTGEIAPYKTKEYYRERMKQSRLRRKKVDKTFYKKFVYAIEIDGKKYLYLNKSDIKINKIDKNDILPEYVKTF